MASMRRHRVLVPLRLHHVAHRQRADVAAVFEVARVECFLSHFEKNFAAIGPLGENSRGNRCHGSRNVLVFVVLLGAPDDSVLGYVGNHLGNFTLRQRDVHDQPHAVVDLVLLAGLERNAREERGKK